MIRKDLLSRDTVLPDGEVASKTIISLNQEQIDNEASIVFHSFYYMCCY